jgi:tetratricopeptide (TPR) repeat protein
LKRFVARLQRLRELAGSPSLNRLAALTATMERPLPRSTISDKLNARSLPDWDFVVSLVTACRQHAEERGHRLPPHLADLARWDSAHLQMLRAVDAAHADERLAAGAAAELGSRAGPGSQAGPRWPATPTVVPRQLPAGVRHCAGRAAELATLTSLLDSAAGAGDTVVISAIDGTAGVGKTTIAVSWAHRIARHFPDGQLYVDLRGFGPTPPMNPTEAIRGFLDAFHVPPERLPASLDAQAALYRSLLADKRVLVVLDNAGDADQVRPLLPGSAGCLVVVTSRNRLISLVAAEGAHLLTLDLLSRAGAQDLLERRLGGQRLAAEPRMVDDIITRCARLPLALSIVAARAAAQPGFPLAALATELREARGRLDALDAGDPALDVRSVFSWSYEKLTAPAARLFRLLGLYSGPDITTRAAASLAGLPVSQARRLLSELTRVHLVNEYATGRVTLHDLLRAYAIELADELERPEERQSALRRLLDHYLHTAVRGALLLDPRRDRISLAPADPDVAPEKLTDQATSLAWFASEQRALLAALDRAAGNGFDTHTWQLAWALATFFDRQGHWRVQADTQQAALAATQRLGDRAGQAHAHRGLARAYGLLGRRDDARIHHEHALTLYAEVGDLAGQAFTYLNLAQIFEDHGPYPSGLANAERALDLYRAAGHRTGQARALNAVGWFHGLCGDYPQALTCCQQALELLDELGDRRGQAATWDSIGYAQHHLGDHRQAAASYQRALHLYRDVGERRGETIALVHLGDTHHDAGDVAAARDAWRQALTILDELEHPDAARIRARLQEG